MRHGLVIEKLGGNVAVAARLGRHRVTVSRWAHNGIPPLAYLSIVKLAAECGITLSIDQLAATNPRFGRNPRSKLGIKLAPRRQSKKVNHAQGG